MEDITLIIEAQIKALRLQRVLAACFVAIVTIMGICVLLLQLKGGSNV